MGGMELGKSPVGRTKYLNKYKHGQNSNYTIKRAAVTSVNGSKVVLQQPSPNKMRVAKPPLQRPQIPDQERRIYPTSQDELVDSICFGNSGPATGTNTSKFSAAVEKALRKVDLKQFVKQNTGIYEDTIKHVGYGEYMPPLSTIALKLQLLSPNLDANARVLDIGSGSGYVTACIGHILNESCINRVCQIGQVVGLEKKKEMVDASRDSIQASAPQLRNLGHCETKSVIRLKTGDPVEGCMKTEGVFDAIHIGHVLPCVPQLFFDLLAPNGLMCATLSTSRGLSSSEEITLFRKDEQGRVFVKPMFEVQQRLTSEMMVCPLPNSLDQ